jgi:hypothetical protein
MRPRISLRTLLLLTAVVAALCCWRDRPRQIANRFVTAFNSNNVEVTDSLFSAYVRCSTLFPFVQRTEAFTAVREPQSLADWLKGEARILFHVKGSWLQDGYAVATASGISRWDRYVHCEAPPPGKTIKANIRSTSSPGGAESGPRNAAG